MKLNNFLAKLDKDAQVKVKKVIAQIKAEANKPKKEWYTVEEISKLCASCAELMKKKNIKRIKASLIEKAITAAWESKPKGWDKDSMKKWWKTATGDHKHKITQCMKKMEGKVDNPGAFCASLAKEI